MRLTFSYRSLSPPDPVPPYAGLTEDQPNRLILDGSLIGRIPSFSRRAMPSSAICPATSFASSVVSSLVIPPTVVRLIMAYMGPSTIMFTITMSDTSILNAEYFRIIRFLLFFFTFIQTIMTMTAAIHSTPSAIR